MLSLQYLHPPRLHQDGIFPPTPLLHQAGSSLYQPLHHQSGYPFHPEDFRMFFSSIHPTTTRWPLSLLRWGVAKPSQVYFGGRIRGMSAMKTEEEVGSLIEYEFRVINLGKPLKSFGTASLNIQWPKESSVGKWLLYLMKINTKGLQLVTCSPEREINPLRLSEESTSTRRKRELEERRPSDGSKVSLFTDKRKHKILSCSGDARCVEMKCPLQGLDSTAVIVLKSRLWNSTFLEDYASYNYLDIIVKASISLDVSANNIVLKNAETQVRLTVFPETTATPFGGVPWWIILVAVLAGILMLALLVLLLWKCGFFKRTKKDEYDAAIHKAEIHTQPSDKLSTEA
ncbi:hypothetical protein PO909_034140 [Leuciscus waleckii]